MLAQLHILKCAAPKAQSLLPAYTMAFNHFLFMHCFWCASVTSNICHSIIVSQQSVFNDSTFCFITTFNTDGQKIYHPMPEELSTLNQYHLQPRQCLCTMEPTEHLPPGACAFKQFLLISTIMSYMTFLVTTKCFFLPHYILNGNCFIQRSHKLAL